jgi:hypothetical protein
MIDKGYGGALRPEGDRQGTASTTAIIRGAGLKPFDGLWGDPDLKGGGRWSGKRLGLEKYGPIGRTYHGMSDHLKAAIAAGVISSAAQHTDDKR